MQILFRKSIHRILFSNQLLVGLLTMALWWKTQSKQDLMEAVGKFKDYFKSPHRLKEEASLNLMSNLNIKKKMELPISMIFLLLRKVLMINTPQTIQGIELMKSTRTLNPL